MKYAHNNIALHSCKREAEGRIKLTRIWAKSGRRRVADSKRYEKPGDSEEEEIYVVSDHLFLAVEQSKS